MNDRYDYFWGAIGEKSGGFLQIDEGGTSHRLHLFGFG
jgi:hypothetical protein